MDVPMELARILITEMGDQQVIFLREKGGERTFPILIGTNEALAIDRRLKHIPTPRPMTHDLLANIIAAMGGTLERITISDLQEHTFIATLFIRQNSELVEVDARPSDAIALGVAFDTPIYVAEHVLQSVLNDTPTKEDRIELLRRRLEMLSEAMSELKERLEDNQFLAESPPEVVAEHRKQLADLKHEFDAISRVLNKLG